MLALCTFTVTSLVPSSPTIFLFKAGSTRGKTSRSRGASESLPQYSEFQFPLARCFISLEGDLNGIQQILMPEGLGQKFDRSGLHRTY
jgi:hypothetical protein